MSEKIVVLKEDIESIFHSLVENDLRIMRDDYTVIVNSIYTIVAFNKEKATSYNILQERNKWRNGEVCSYSNFEEHLKSLTNNNIKPAFCYYENGMISKMYFSLNYQLKLLAPMR